jgi:hypothetical protein
LLGTLLQYNLITKGYGGISSLDVFKFEGGGALKQKCYNIITYILELVSFWDMIVPF